VAILARLVAPHRHPRFRPEERFLKFQSQIFAEIGAALHPAAPASASGAPTEHIAEAEEFSEDVAEVLKNRGIEARTLPCSTTESGVAVAIIRGTLVGVGEHGVGLADFFEFFFRVRVVRIAVGMVLQSELAIGALQLYLSD
jgi:hypothetical protein